MKRVKFIIAFVIGFSLVVFIRCQREDNNKDDKPVIALVMKTLNNPFFIDMEKGANETAGKLGIELIVQAAEREVDVEKQMQIIENLIQRKVDAICITPSGSKEIIPAILK
ncbi:MAG: substrate-binding domain-containing protein, partial [Ignavibacteriaceae bacterium]